ncbi:MAG: hypothetical protein ABIT76_00690 [Chthoniobacterales bacterium]
MNLAIHDIRQLSRLHESGQTQTWAARKVVGWVTRGQFLRRPHLASLQREVPLHLMELAPEEEDFFLIFQQPLRRLTHRESLLLYLADRTGSVVLTGEPLVVQIAQSLGLRVCSGSESSMDLLFPLLPQSVAKPAATFKPPGLSVTDIVNDLSASLSPEPPPSSWRVPDRDEPVSRPIAIALRRSKEPGRQLGTTQRNQQ